MDYQLKPSKIQIVKERTVVKEKFEVPVDGHYWKLYGGLKTINQPDRFGVAPSLLLTKDKLGIETSYDLKLKNINIGFYYLIFKL